MFMKILKFIAAGSFAAFLATAGATNVYAASASSNDRDEVVINASQLPQPAREFMNTYFANDPVSKVVRDTDNGQYEYEVFTKSGAKVDFNASGAWEDVDMPKSKAVPATIVPQPIANYVAKNYKSRKINEISVKRNGYSVELCNGIDLEFDANGQFLRVDR